MVSEKCLTVLTIRLILLRYAFGGINLIKNFEIKWIKGNSRHLYS